MGAGVGGPALSGQLVVAVFARADSRRLPGKVLADLGGRPLLDRVVSRARRIPATRATVVATSIRPVDDAVAAWASAAGLPVHRGPADDVLRRCLEVAHSYDADGVVRVSGDSPFIDPAVGERVVRCFLAAQPELATNVAPRSWPAGCSVEVIATSLLERLDAGSLSEDDREHVTRWCYAHPADVVIANVATDPPVAGNLTVDEPDDLERARWIVERLGARADEAGIDEVADLGRRWDGGER